ncbi:MAG: histidinol dehydrogenase [Pseudomonadota bacterium]
MQLVIWSNLNEKQRRDALRRPLTQKSADISITVADIFRNVENSGDSALRDYTKSFDDVDVEKLRVPAEEMEAAVTSLAPDLAEAMRVAIANIRAFHALQKPQEYDVETMSGVRCSFAWRAIERVGLYVPGGTAPLFSSVLMQAIPAKIAGCKKIALCSPPDKKTGKIPQVILAAASLCGVDKVYAVGGAQAIAALSFGTETIPQVDKIFGPGNAYVMRAKEYAAQLDDGPAIDMPAGPSEVMVVADNAASPQWVAADLLAQAEHDEQAQAMLVCFSKDFAAQVQGALKQQIENLPRRAIAEKSIAHAKAICVENRDDAVHVVNTYAPEHLILQCEKAQQLVPQIDNAGAIFVGAMTPETAGDYASGANHVLPTSGRCRAYSGLSVLSFMKNITVQTLSSAGFHKLAPSLVTLARAEGLEAHAQAVLYRMEKV